MKMKSSILASAIATLSLSFAAADLPEAPTRYTAEQAPFPSHSLALGYAAPALENLHYIQGEPINPQLNTEGEVYVLELWATWCGPCLASLPHLRTVHERFYDRGLRLVAVNVLENDQPMIEEFVSQNEDFAFPVAYSGTDSAFAENYMHAFGIRGIPQSLIIRDGIIWDIIHPNEITDELVDTLFDPDIQYSDYAPEKSRRRDMFNGVKNAFAAQDWQAALELYPEADAIMGNFYADGVRIEALARSGQTEPLIAISQNPEDLDSRNVLHLYTSSLQYLPASEALDTLSAAAASYYHEHLDPDNTNPEHYITYLAYLRSCLITDASQETRLHMSAVIENAFSSDEFENYVEADNAQLIRDHVLQALANDQMGPISAMIDQINAQTQANTNNQSQES